MAMRVQQTWRESSEGKAEWICLRELCCGRGHERELLLLGRLLGYTLGKPLVHSRTRRPKCLVTLPREGVERTIAAAAVASTDRAFGRRRGRRQRRGCIRLRRRTTVLRPWRRGQLGRVCSDHGGCLSLLLSRYGARHGGLIGTDAAHPFDVDVKFLRVRRVATPVDEVDLEALRLTRHRRAQACTVHTALRRLWAQRDDAQCKRATTDGLSLENDVNLVIPAHPVYSKRGHPQRTDSMSA